MVVGFRSRGRQWSVKVDRCRRRRCHPCRRLAGTIPVSHVLPTYTRLTQISIHSLIDDPHHMGRQSRASVNPAPGLLKAGEQIVGTDVVLGKEQSCGSGSSFSITNPNLQGIIIAP